MRTRDLLAASSLQGRAAAPQAASLSGCKMTRQVLIVVGIALLSFGGVGIVVGLAWLTVSHIHGTIPYIFDNRTEILLFVLPVLLLVIAIIGAAFIAGALAPPRKGDRAVLRPHHRLHFRT